VTVPPAPEPGRVAWLVLVYRLSAKPGLKVTIRRRLIAIGAVFPANAVAAVPVSPAAERAFRQIRSTIGEAGGSAQVLRAEVIEGARDLAAAFNQARDQDYAEIIAECDRLLAGIAALTAAGQFRYPDLAGQDAELRRLSMRNDAIRTWDALGAAYAGLALSSLARCRMAVDDFARCVYQTDSAAVTGIVRRSRSPGAR
jgi:hypothetical protein